jgi:hypothetical protein
MFLPSIKCYTLSLSINCTLLWLLYSLARIPKCASDSAVIHDGVVFRFTEKVIHFHSTFFFFFFFFSKGFTHNCSSWIPANGR